MHPSFTLPLGMFITARQKGTTTFRQYFSPPQPTQPPIYVLLIQDSILYSGYFIKMLSHNTWPFVSDSLLFTGFQGLPTL